MEKRKKSLEQIALIYSLKCGFALILIFQLCYLIQISDYGIFLSEMLISNRKFYLTDLGIVKYFNMPVIFYSIYKGTKYFKLRHNFCSLTYKQSLMSGFLISIISVLIVAAYTIIFYKYISPESLDLVMEKEYLNPDTTKTQRALNFLRPYRMTFFVTMVFTFLISFKLIKTERSH